jgi:hypothetical protein
MIEVGDDIRVLGGHHGTVRFINHDVLQPYLCEMDAPFDGHNGGDRGAPYLGSQRGWWFRKERLIVVKAASIKAEEDGLAEYEAILEAQELISGHI